MAKRRRKRSSTATATRIVRIPSARQAAPIIKVSAPRAPSVRKARRRGRRRSGGGIAGIGAGFGGMLGLGLGGAIYGLAVKNGYVAKLPAIPVIGRTGTAAILLDYWGRHGGGDIVKKAGVAAAVIAGYQLGSEGTITGAGGADFHTSGYDGYYSGDDGGPDPDDYDDGDEPLQDVA